MVAGKTVTGVSLIARVTGSQNQPFLGFSYETWKDRILFYAEDPDATGDGVPMGIYDLAQKKVLFEPQFLDVTFHDNGDMEVEEETEDEE